MWRFGPAFKISRLYGRDEESNVRMSSSVMMVVPISSPVFVWSLYWPPD
jgi:hypothetical protein